MRLAVLDTNVIVSAGIRPEGAPAKLVMDWILDGQVQLVTSPLIVKEYRAIVGRPEFHRFGFPPLWLDFLIEESMSLPDPAGWPHVGPDPKDIPFLALAHAAGAWFLTGNIRHFPEQIRDGNGALAKRLPGTSDESKALKLWTYIPRRIRAVRFAAKIGK